MQAPHRLSAEKVLERHETSVVFTMPTFCQMAYALCVRKRTQSLFTQSWLG